MPEHDESEESLEDRIARHEAMLLRRERYCSDAEFRHDAGWWMFYTRQGCDILRQLLQNPDYADQHEKIQGWLARRTAQLNNLENILNEDKEGAD